MSLSIKSTFFHINLILKGEIMEFDNKTILISGLIICAITAMVLNFEQIALAIVSGLVGYLSKDKIDQYLSNKEPVRDDRDDL